MEARLIIANPPRNAPNNSITFLLAVLGLARIKFEGGQTSRKKFLAQAKQDASLQTRFNLSKTFPSVRGEPFNMDATGIPNTHFIASAGPRLATMEAFIQDTAYHPTRSTLQVVALGDGTDYHDAAFQDFHDYCLKPRETKYGRYHAVIKRISGEATTDARYEQTTPHGIVQSELHVDINGTDKRIIPVTVFEVNDGYSIKFIKSTKDIKEVMWGIFQLSLRGDIWVHCASGIGRTGHFILTMEILKHYDEIFSSDTEQAAADKILALLTNMRSVRIGMVLAEEQFSDAIINAQILYHFALAKGYILPDSPFIRQIVTPISMFPVAKPEEKETKEVAPQANPAFPPPGY